MNLGAPELLILLIGLMTLKMDQQRRAGFASDDVPRVDYLSDLPQWRRLMR